MGGDHGHNKLVLPDWRQWKIEGTPLEIVQRRLASRGLKDPWGRSVFLPKVNIAVSHLMNRITDYPFFNCPCSNEAWRYSGGFARPVTLPEVLLKGFKWGFAAFAVALAVEYTFFPPKKGGH